MLLRAKETETGILSVGFKIVGYFLDFQVTVNQEIFMNNLFGEFGEPFRNAKFNPAKYIFACLDFRKQ